jgi:hypothetical protein
VCNTCGRNERIYALLCLQIHIYLYLWLIMGKFGGSIVVCKNRLLYEVRCSSNNKDYVLQFNSSVLSSVAPPNVDKYSPLDLSLSLWVHHSCPVSPSRTSEQSNHTHQFAPRTNLERLLAYPTPPGLWLFNCSISFVYITSGGPNRNHCSLNTSVAVGGDICLPYKELFSLIGGISWVPVAKQQVRKYINK